MTILYIYKEEDKNESNELLCLRDGSYNIGRENPVVCKDHRISRKHALITVHKGGATIQSTHINPTFFKSSGDGPIKVLKDNNILDLNNGNQFALLENYIWFTVKIISEHTASSVVDDKKRIHEDNIFVNTKRKKINECASSHIGDPNNNALPTVLNDTYSEVTKENVKIETSTEIKQEPIGREIKQEPISQEVKQELIDEEIKQELINEDIKQEPIDEIEKVLCNSATTLVDDNIDIDPSTSRAPNIRREHCWYGKQCYRKNPDHKANFSHPWDDDYESDSNNNRPVCPFGVRCYRRNTTHRRQFEHFGPPAPRPRIVGVDYHHHHYNANQSDSDQY